MSEIPKAFPLVEEVCDRCSADGPTENHLCSICFQLEEEYYEQQESLGIERQQREHEAEVREALAQVYGSLGQSVAPRYH